ncbi:hypothetical protein K490DRAFT_36305 [Saccharata proteae CBS 121410]|uniref:CNH domain-containing protein n=1 Tax=Saccharata proteae CBS 121410 TaxID=1314787 RepID=A0A9P4M074_9PEZI|nr:hypothetical protein K490DRAFT_36305 [Saccharata proteae CBS 121410]
MLSAFTARPLVELKQRDKSRIESILAYGDKLLVGLHTGSLRIYRVNELHSEPTAPPDEEDDAKDTQAPKQRAVDLLREEEKFSRRPVQQLAVIKEAGILISLSDGYVSIHDLQSYALQEKLEKTKGATSFAVTSNIVKDPSTGIPSIVSRLAVAVKRRIMLWSWQDMELSGETAEITLIASVKSLTWATGTKIIAGMDPGFVLVDIESQEITDIVRPGSLSAATEKQGGERFGAVNSSGMGYMGMGSWVPKPMATPLSEGQLLLAKDVNTLFIDSDGKPIEKRQIPWALAPEGIGYSYPYLLALQPPSKGVLEVRNPDTVSLLQTISLPNASFLHVPQPNISLAHAGKGFLVASDRCVWRMSALDYEAQIDELVSKSRFDEAISLVNMLEDTLLKDKPGRLRQVQILKARGLFEQRKYRESMDLFSDALAPPETVISLYPKVIAGDLSSVPEPEVTESEDEEEQKEGDHNNDEERGITSTPVSTISRAMFGRLKADTKKVDSDSASVRSLKMDGSDGANAKARSAENVAEDKPLEGKDLVIAVTALFGFLAQTRAQLQKHIHFDGSLKRALPENPPEDYRPPFSHFILLPDAEPVDIDWAQRLRKVAGITDTTLFRAYMFARPGMAGPLFRLDNFCDPDVVKEKLYESGRYTDLIDFLHGKKMHKEALELLANFGKKDEDEAEFSMALAGPRRTVAYLQQLPPEMIDLILEYAEWPVKADPEIGMEIFLADHQNAENLPRHRVLDFLHNVDSKLAVRYLEHVIDELNDETPDFHQHLIDFYLERLKSTDEGAFKSPDDRAQWRERLQNFLKSSSHYNKARAFQQLPADEPDFYESRAIVLSKMGQHKQALQIYVFQLEDYDKAELYCNQTYINETTTPSAPVTSSRRQPPPQDPEDAEPSIYHTLLSLYLTPPPPYKPNWEPALSLLSKHGARLPASSTLNLVPDVLPVKELESYFRGRIRSANSVQNEERIVSSLRGVEKVAVEAALLLGEGGKGGRNRHVVISDERHCQVCGKRFGASAIRVYPDDSVVHYGCVNRSAGVGRRWM